MPQSNKQYNCLQAIPLSFFSKKLYRDVANNWGSGVILYLLLVLLLCWAAMMLSVQPAVTRASMQFADHIIPQFPRIVITKGIVTTPENRPYIINDKASNKVVAIVDTSGKYTTIENNNSPFLLTKSEFIYVDRSGGMRIRKLSNDLNMILNPAKIKNIVADFAGFIWVILLPFLLIFSFIYRVIEAVIYAVFGKIFALMLGVPLCYEEIIKLAIVALTPVLIVSTIVDMVGARFNHELLLYFLLAIVYLFFAVSANKKMDQSTKQEA